MDKIKVNRLNLLETLRKNRTAHAEEYVLAEKGYWLEFETRLAKALKQIRKTGSLNQEFGHPMMGYSLSPARPENHTKDYDVIIKMLEFSVEDVIELDHAKFQQYVMDNWQWSGSAKAVNSYLAGVASGALR